MDYKTLFTVLISVLLIQAATLAQAWRQNRQEIGIRDWAVGAMWMTFGGLFSVAGLNLHAYGATLPEDELLRILGASFGATGWFYVWLGTRHFYRKPTFGYRPIAWFLVAFTALLMLHLWLPLPKDWRVIMVSAAIAVFSALTLREFWQRPLLRNPALLLMITMLVFTTATWLLRSLASINHTAHVTRYAFTDTLSLYDAIVASVTLTISMIVLTNERINQRLHEQATHDPLTGVLNRRAFYEASAPILAALRRSTETLVICLLDLDHFKRINDNFGHAAGDSVLKHFAQLAESIMRQGDLFARIGGEEFTALFRNCDPDSAEHALLRLRNACLQQRIELDDKYIDLTFCAGLCPVSGPARVTLEELLDSADHAMYSAKSEGRNRIVVAPYALGEPLTAFGEDGNPKAV